MSGFAHQKRLSDFYGTWRVQWRKTSDHFNKIRNNIKKKQKIDEKYLKRKEFLFLNINNYGKEN